MSLPNACFIIHSLLRSFLRSWCSTKMGGDSLVGWMVPVVSKTYAQQTLQPYQNPHPFSATSSVRSPPHPGDRVGESQPTSAEISPSTRVLAAIQQNRSSTLTGGHQSRHPPRSGVRTGWTSTTTRNHLPIHPPNSPTYPTATGSSSQ
jgi:hypothetical protein